MREGCRVDEVVEFEEHPGPKSSWASAAYAGWSRDRREYKTDGDGEGGWTWPSNPAKEALGEWNAILETIPKRRWRDFSWLAAGPLLDSANDQVARLIHDLVNDRRQRWVAAQRAAGAERRWKDLVVQEPQATSFFVLGDPGEADPTQYGVVEPMLAVDRQRGSDFALVMSDVIYPAGDINDYVNAFYIPYKGYPRTIYALPGNHDWYDGLNGFMFHFCGAEPLPPVKFRLSTYTAPERLARRMWRDGARPFRPRLLQYRREALRNPRDRPWAPRQPGPYFAIDVGDELRLVSIDTGIRGTLDREQGEWLVRVSRDATRVKVLLTGKPLWVDGEYHPCPIEWEGGCEYPAGYETVDDVVRDPDNGYVAAIGGDIHNYQRYPVRVTRDGTTRTLPYLVSGGAGAYMSATHSFVPVNHVEREDQAERKARLADQQAGTRPPARAIDPPEGEVEPVTEEGFRCYPSRPDSLAFYARSYGRRVGYTGTSLAVVAAAIVATLFATGAGWHTKVGDQVFWEIAVAAYLMLGTLAVLGGAMYLVDRVAPRGYKFPVVVFSTPVLAYGLIELLRLLGDDTWGWGWQAGLLSLGTLLLPLVVVLAVYYGFGSTGRPSSELIVPRAIVFGILLMGEIALWHDWNHVETAEEMALLICGALACIALIVLVVGVAMRWHRGRKKAREWFRRLGQRWWLNLPLTLLVYGAFIGPTIARGWDLWEVQVLVWAAAALWLLLAIVFWVALVAVGRWAVLGALHRGRLDPGQAAKWLEDRGYSPGLDETRVATSTDRAARWLCDFLMRTPARVKVSEIGNDDKPPMFKSFLHAEIESANGGRQLVISCYGVTGWGAHEGVGEVPCEDRVRIDLSKARTELATRRAGVNVAG
jgi:hypothetical protein